MLKMEDLMSLVAIQNFVPVVDDNEVFIGIIRRMDIIQYLK
jgi:predicted transcriptional regulator